MERRGTHRLVVTLVVEQNESAEPKTYLSTITIAELKDTGSRHVPRASDSAVDLVTYGKRAVISGEKEGYLMVRRELGSHLASGIASLEAKLAVTYEILPRSEIRGFELKQS